MHKIKIRIPTSQPKQSQKCQRQVQWSIQQQQTKREKLQLERIIQFYCKWKSLIESSSQRKSNTVNFTNNFFRCRKVTEAMLQFLKHKNHKIVKLTLELMEICSKNGNLQFHKNLATQEFSDQFLLLLKRVISIICLKFLLEKRKDRIICEKVRKFGEKNTVAQS